LLISSKGDEVKGRPEYAMKKLSPTEPALVVKLTVDTPRTYSVSRVEKVLRKDYGFKTRSMGETSVEATYSTTLSRYAEVLDKIAKLPQSFPDTISANLAVCIEYWIVIKTLKCLHTSNCHSTPEHVICITEANGKQVYVHCSRKRGYVSLKPLQKPVKVVVDPLQLPSTVFLYCTVMRELPSFASIFEKDVHLFKSIVEHMLESSDERPIH